MTAGNLAARAVRRRLGCPAGELTLKHGMQSATARVHGSHGSLAIAVATTPWVLLGLVVFAVSAVGWLGALSRVPLNVAYPFNALGYIVILAASVLVLHERANLLTWAASPPRCVGRPSWCSPSKSSAWSADRLGDRPPDLGQQVLVVDEYLLGPDPGLRSALPKTRSTAGTVPGSLPWRTTKFA